MDFKMDQNKWIPEMIVILYLQIMLRIKIALIF